MKFMPCKLRRSPLARAFTTVVILAALFPALVRAQTWDGQGVSTGNGSTDIDDTANWTGGVVTGNFTSINQAPGILYLTTASTSVSSLDFGWTTNGLSLTLDALDSGDTINLASGGAIYLPNVTTASSVITLTSNVTLNLGTGFTAIDTIGYHTGATGNVSNAVVINALVTGSAGSGGSLQIPFVSGAGAPIVELNNNSNSFDAPISVSGGYLFYTSVGNVSGGNSALGDPTSAAHGTIIVGSGDALIYDGTSNTTSNRILSLSGSGYIINDSSSATTQTFSSLTVTSSGTYSFDAVNSGSALDITGVITGGSESVRTDFTLAVAGPSGTPTVGAATGAVEFANAANTYGGATQVDGGTLIVTKLANGLSASSIGESSNLASNLLLNAGGSAAGAILSYQGTGDSTDRLFEIRGKTEVDSSGTGALDFTNTGAIALQSAQASTLTFGGTYTGSANTLTPIIGDYNSANKTSVVISGAGAWSFSGANTYSGSTTINDGVLIATNASATSATGTGAVSVTALSSTSYGTLSGGNSGTLTTLGTGSHVGRLQTYTSGAGAVSGAVTVSSLGHLDPGVSGIGTITLGTLTLSSGSVEDYEFSGTANDFTVVSGTNGLTINGGGFNLYQVGTTNTFGTAGTYNLFSYTGTLEGSLSSLSVLDQVAGMNYAFYNDTTDDIVQLEVTAVPEPTVWALMLGGLIFLASFRRFVARRDSL